MKRSRKPNPINAGSMSDIAFLLLIFFLVTTTMDSDQGIMVTLPEYIEDQKPIPIPQSETLEININAADKLLVENKVMPVSALKEEVIKHLNNYGRDENYSSSPKKAVISLKNHDGTSYAAYIAVYNEIRAGYTVIRDEASMKKYGRKYKDLVGDDRKDIKALYPVRLSEAEPIAEK